eukprot:CAMPEP_0118889636 /NCGR_PEP_ID=MMETSP1166-20130328/463_1 /TAXON_ID=1104430 /ORGANISM="Chrysoreinhardia sp, Strain CCMP3193" /LENGTH=277 /DNA_ID=CAMNT_0006828229 /DNA_START=135 /DNA_END=968 /DNA_ORIENTATION=-
MAVSEVLSSSLGLENKVVSGALLGFVVFVVVYFLTTLPSAKPPPPAQEEEKEPPRDFTPAQLREFDGRNSEKIYVSIKRDVFDVTAKKEMYGPDGSYGTFAGRDASRCLGKMSLDAKDLDGPIDDLLNSEVDALDEWHTTFKHIKGYPVVGRLSEPPPPSERTWTRAELRACLDRDQATPPAGRLHAPLLVAVRGTVYDVSYGGVEHYGPGGPYYRFCGKDASRALAKMSLDPNDIDAAQDSSDLSDLDDKENKILDDWQALFARKYPAVGTLLVEE